MARRTGRGPGSLAVASGAAAGAFVAWNLTQRRATVTRVAPVPVPLADGVPDPVAESVCLAFDAALAGKPPRPQRRSLRPVEALARRQEPTGPLLPGLLPRTPVATFLSATPYAAPVPERVEGVTYLYAALPEPRAVPRAVVRPQQRKRRLPPAVAPAVTGARRLAVVGAAAVLVLTVPFGRIVTYVEGRLDPPSQQAAQPLRRVPLIPGLRLAAAAQTVATAVPLAGPQVVATVAGGGLTPIPATVFAAYSAGANWANDADPGCALSWSVLAGIGEVESGHAASYGALRPGWNGTASPPVLGPLLDGSLPGTPRVPDTDGGLLDGNDAVDRAVGPMQFLPSSWAVYGVDASGDGRADPQNIGDAAAAAGLYLCAGGADLSNPAQLAGAVRRYNHSDAYVRAVLAAGAGYLAASYGPGPQGVALAAIAFGYAHLGDPYLWGGNGPLYDCSGLTQAAYRSAGIDIPRTAEQQWQRLPKVSENDLQPGDLLFFNAGEFVPGLPGHVGIYLGAGLMLDDPHTGAFVRIEPIQGFGSWVGAARPSLLATFPGAPLPGTGFVLPVATPVPGAPAVPTLGPPAPPVPGATATGGPTGGPTGPTGATGPSAGPTTGPTLAPAPTPAPVPTLNPPPAEPSLAPPPTEPAPPADPPADPLSRRAR